MNDYLTTFAIIVLTLMGTVAIMSTISDLRPPYYTEINKD